MDEDVLADLAGRSSAELLRLQTALGGALHGRLVARAAAGFGGVVFSCPACPGLGDAFSSFDGSSDYVRGDLTPIGAAATAAVTGAGGVAPGGRSDPGAGLVAGVGAFLRAHRLPGELLVVVAGAGAGPEPAEVGVTVTGSGVTEAATIALPAVDAAAVEPVGAADPSARFESRRRLASVAALLAVARWLDRTGDTGARVALDELLAVRWPAPGGASLASQVDRLAARNADAWAAARRRLAGTSRLAVGESFTLGRMARLCASAPGADAVVELLYGWYAPSYKAAVGVPAERLTDREIAEPGTAALAACGLIEHGPGAADVGVATTGWANNTWLPDRDGTLTDFFSVAVAGPAAGDGSARRVETLRCSVTATAGRPPSEGRRQLTRELGVTAALVLLLHHVDAADEAHRLAEVLRRWATVDRG